MARLKSTPLLRKMAKNLRKPCGRAISDTVTCNRNPYLCGQCSRLNEAAVQLDLLLDALQRTEQACAVLSAFKEGVLQAQVLRELGEN